MLLLSVSSTILFQLIKEPLLYLFGASDASYLYADAYLRIYLVGTSFTMLATGLNGFINAQGSQADPSQSHTVRSRQMPDIDTVYHII